MLSLPPTAILTHNLICEKIHILRYFLSYIARKDSRRLSGYKRYSASNTPDSTALFSIPIGRNRPRRIGLPPLFRSLLMLFVDRSGSESSGDGDCHA
jgi:hypothetical protein